MAGESAAGALATRGAVEKRKRLFRRECKSPAAIRLSTLLFWVCPLAFFCSMGEELCNLGIVSPGPCSLSLLVFACGGLISLSLTVLSKESFSFARPAGVFPRLHRCAHGWREQLLLVFNFLRSCIRTEVPRPHWPVLFRSLRCQTTAWQVRRKNLLFMYTLGTEVYLSVSGGVYGYYGSTELMWRSCWNGRHLPATESPHFFVRRCDVHVHSTYLYADNLVHASI